MKVKSKIVIRKPSEKIDWNLLALIKLNTKFRKLIFESPPKKFTSDESENEMKNVTNKLATNANFESGKATFQNLLNEFRFKSSLAFQ